MKGRKGQKNTPEHNAKIAAAHRGRKLSPEHIEKTRQANLGRKQSPEEIEKRRLANTGKKRSPEFCEQMRQLQANLTPEQKAANAERLRQMNLNRDPSEKERLRLDLIARNKARKGEKREFPPVRTVGSTDRVFYVYEHWRTDKGACFYVGKGFGKRANDMRNGRNKWHQFVQEYVHKNGHAIEVKIIATGLTEREAFDVEMARIEFWKNDGADLVNITIGGDGPTGRKHTEEWKRALSDRMKGRPVSIETRAKMSAAAMGNKKGLGKKKPRELVERLAALNRGKKRSPEVRKLLSDIRKANPTFKGKCHTPEAIEKIKAGNIGRVRSPETKRKMREHKKTPEHKNKLRQTSLAWWAKKKAEKASEIEE